MTLACVGSPFSLWFVDHQAMRTKETEMGDSSSVTAQLYSRVKGVKRMARTAGPSPGLRLAAQSCHTLGSQNLIIIWAARGEHQQGPVLKVMLEIGQTFRLRDNFQRRSCLQT